MLVFDLFQFHNQEKEKKTAEKKCKKIYVCRKLNFITVHSYNSTASQPPLFRVQCTETHSKKGKHATALLLTTHAFEPFVWKAVSSCTYRETKQGGDSNCHFGTLLCSLFINLWVSHAVSSVEDDFRVVTEIMYKQQKKAFIWYIKRLSKKFKFYQVYKLKKRKT